MDWKKRDNIMWGARAYFKLTYCTNDVLCVESYMLHTSTAIVVYILCNLTLLLTWCWLIYWNLHKIKLFCSANAVPSNFIFQKIWGLG